MREDELASCTIKLSVAEQKHSQLALALQNEIRLVIDSIRYVCNMYIRVYRKWDRPRYIVTLLVETCG